MEFGETNANKVVQFVEVIGLKGETVQVPYNDEYVLQKFIDKYF